MRKLVIAAALAGSSLALSACADATGDTDAATTDEAAGAEVATPEAAPETAAVLDASTATADQLAAVEGVSPELATAIVAGQPYASVTEFNAVLMNTLDEQAAAAVRERVFVPINLNSASREEIELVPGMTPRMAHEFEEYRPYADLEEFDREIGKYVEPAEVERFRRYVTL